MFDEYSYPVKTHCYIPQIAFYFLTGHKESANKLTLFGKIAHHSNGQNGNFYTENGNINLQSGNFATNYVEHGFLKSFYSNQLNSFKFIKSSIEIHPKKWMLEELEGQYSGLRWYNTFLAYKLPMKSNLIKNREQRANFSVKAETTLMFDNISNWDTFNIDRFNTSLIVYYHPKFLEDIGFYVQFYHGKDYYKHLFSTPNQYNPFWYYDRGFTFLKYFNISKKFALFLYLKIILQGLCFLAYKLNLFLQI